MVSSRPNFHSTGLCIPTVTGVEPVGQSLVGAEPQGAAEQKLAARVVRAAKRVMENMLVKMAEAGAGIQ